MKFLDKLYQRNDITFAIIWIVAYVVIASITDSASREVGIEKCVTAPALAIMSIILWAWVSHAGLKREFGLVAPITSATRMLLYLPLIIIAFYRFCFGVTMNYPVLETVLFIISMLSVGFLEEMIFRGLLFRGMAKSNLTAAIIVSAITFGAGHIVNVFNASGQDLPETLVQVAFAIIIGFVLVFVLLKSGSLWPCIIWHGVYNSLSAFSDEAAQIAVLGSEFNAILLVLGLAIIVGGGYLAYLAKLPSAKG
ncbi:MAG: CPBP family intramembrane metalloprotease [Eggerthellaceae bacterium]|nr:CPBP family intramembrane metalloprotease [Eggerthellaceae bacterium]